MNSIINLGMHLYADTFISKEQLKLSEPVYPLECCLDISNGLISLKYQTSPNERYNLYDYSYTSSNSDYSKSYWQNYFLDVSDKLKLNINSEILEIGSNDGYLLSRFKENNHKVLGVDSSKYISDLANKNNIETLNNIFDYKFAKKISQKFNLIIANNVFNHSNDPRDFLLGVKELLKTDGNFVFEVPYWFDTIKDGRFDQIYHEHVSYFTIFSAVNILKEVGLYVYDVDHTEYHGGSIRVYSSSKKITLSSKLKALIKEEIDYGLFDVKFYEKYQESIDKTRSETLIKIHELKLKNKKIIAVGAAAKGNTYLNYYGLNNTLIDFVTDSSAYKIGKYTPLTRIPILSDEEVFSLYSEEVYVLILSWNISEIIKSKLKSIYKNINYIN